MCHVKLGIHPAGALPYFLPLFIGRGKAAEILYNGDDIGAEEAFNLGLVNKILPTINFEQGCFNEVVKLVSGNEKVLGCTKELLKYSVRDLEEYISIEESKFLSK